MIHDEVENESMEIDQELIQILELPNEDIETVNIIVFQMFKNTWKTLKKKDANQTPRDENYYVQNGKYTGRGW